jgi:hypothetical protein
MAYRQWDYSIIVASKKGKYGLSKETTNKKIGSKYFTMLSFVFAISVQGPS